MPYNEGTRLIGSDGVITVGTVTNQQRVNGNNADDLDTLLAGIDSELFIVRSKAGNSTFGILAVGDVFYAYDRSLVLRTGDTMYIPQNYDSVANIVSWQINMSKIEIENTTLGRKIRTYRGGRLDLSGDFTVIRTIDLDPIFDRNFFRQVVFEEAPGHVGLSVFERNDETPFQFFGWTQKDKDLPRQLIYLPNIEFFNTSFGVIDGQRQEVISGFRLTQDSPDEITIYHIR